MQALTDITPGARIGNYVLIEKIGEGAFAQVWKAKHHERTERFFAVKIPTDPAFRKQLQREGKLPDIHHDNVVPILDSDTRGADVPYIVMPYYTGGTLADLIAQHPTGLPEERVEALLKDILTGLAELHQRGIVHRDIKPSNVLLNEHGRAAIADFGLWSGADGDHAVRSMQQSLSMASTDGRHIAGTLAYMAPEVRDGQPATPASDVYSVGVMLFETLVGRRPEGIELPGRTRSGLKNWSHWNGLFYWSTRVRSERYADAAALRVGLTHGPKPLPAWLEYQPPPVALTHQPQSLPAWSDHKPLPVARTTSGKANLNKELTLDLGSGVKMELLLIPAGEFLMGSPANRKAFWNDEGPQHRVTITKPYYLGKYEVTQAQWQVVMGSNPSNFSGCPDCPVEQVSWDDCQAYCKKLSAKTGRTIRLPTEAEWEYACRAGTVTPFHTGPTISTAQANYNGNFPYGSGSKGEYRQRTTKVGSFSPNGFGLYDMHGNVWEWCQDWYGEKYYGSSPGTDPSGPTTGSWRVIRGGAWYDLASGCQTTDRNNITAASRLSYYGFRLVLDSD